MPNLFNSILFYVYYKADYAIKIAKLIIVFQFIFLNVYAQYTAEWMRSGASVGNIEGNEVVVDVHGNVYVTGSFPVNFSPNFFEV